jgi:hypothetical protein
MRQGLAYLPFRSRLSRFAITDGHVSCVGANFALDYVTKINYKGVSVGSVPGGQGSERAIDARVTRRRWRLGAH